MQFNGFIKSINIERKHLDYIIKYDFIDGIMFIFQELFPLKKGKLNHLEIMVPNHAISYLERVYGNCLDKNGPCWKEQIKYNPFFHQFDINLNLN